MKRIEFTFLIQMLHFLPVLAPLNMKDKLISGKYVGFIERTFRHLLRLHLQINNAYSKLKIIYS